MLFVTNALIMLLLVIVDSGDVNGDYIGDVGVCTGLGFGDVIVVVGDVIVVVGVGGGEIIACPKGGLVRSSGVSWCSPPSP